MVRPSLGVHLLWLLLLVPLAQAADPLAVELPAEPVFLHGGDTVDLEVVLRSQDLGQLQHVSVSAQLIPDGNWAAAVSPAESVMGAGTDRTVTVSITADDRPAPRDVTLVITVHSVTADLQASTVLGEVAVHSTGTDAIMGRWDNPLPDPFDGAWGSFGLNLAIWWVLAFVVKVLISPTLRLLTLRTKNDLDDRIIKIVNTPAFVLVFTFGLVRSLEIFALPAWVFTWLTRGWATVLGITLVWTAYKLWHAVVLTVGRRMARRTKSDLDDRLYPVMEKIGGIIIVVIGLFYLLGSYDVDLTLFAAGGAVASLVIAFAAQDTLANFFAGVFILLDRPFRVGDRIELPEQEHWGDVVHVGLRTTQVRTQDNRMVIFPNNYIASNPVVNHSYPDPHYRIQVDFQLPYGSDVEFVRKTLVESVKPVEGVWAERSPEALLLEFGENGQEWRLRWWINSYVDTRRMYDRVNSHVIKRMAEANIRIPYPQRVWWDAHKLMERDSTGGLLPAQLSDVERRRLEQEAETERKKADRLEQDEIDAMRRSEAKKQQEAEARRKEKAKALDEEE